jgi:hypothetical protein
MHPGCDPMHVGCDPMHVGCDPMHPRLRPYARRLRPYARRLRSYARRLRPYARRLRSYVPRHATPSASRSCYSPPTRGRSSSSSDSAAPLSSPSCAISSSRGLAPPGRSPPPPLPRSSAPPPLPPPLPLHRTAPHRAQDGWRCLRGYRRSSSSTYQGYTYHGCRCSSSSTQSSPRTSRWPSHSRATPPSGCAPMPCATSLLRVPATSTPRRPRSAGRAAV